ncbi:hypothetical protein F4X10_08155 [Candidatus Poribacteria bacterium]|nr:hypothetical protein [Candidatus Poribacteria bacterium]
MRGYYRIKELMARGWYRTDINMFLGEPHLLVKNADGWPLKLYKISIVHDVENTEGFVWRPAAVAPMLFLQGLSLFRISEVLSVTENEVKNYTKKVRKAVRQGELERKQSKRKQSERKQRRQRTHETMTPLQRKGIVYFRVAGHSWAEVAHLVNLPLNIVTNFGRTQSFRQLRRDAVLCLDNWFASKENT